MRQSHDHGSRNCTLVRCSGPGRIGCVSNQFTHRDLRVTPIQILAAQVRDQLGCPCYPEPGIDRIPSLGADVQRQALR